MAGEKPSVTFAKGDAPQDKFHVVKILAFFMGFAVLFPSSAITASSDLYGEIYGETKGENLLFYMGLAITLTSPFFQLLVQRVQNKISYTSRVMACLLANTTLAALFPFVLLLLSDTVSFPLVIFIAFMIGMNNAVLKLTFFSLTSYYPAKFQHLIVVGKGLSPLLVVLLKMAIKLISEKFYPHDLPFAIRRGSIVFFSLAAFVPALCAFIYRYARKTSLFSKHYFPSFRIRKLALAAQHPEIQDQSTEIAPESMAGLTTNEDQDQLHFDQDDSNDDLLNTTTTTTIPSSHNDTIIDGSRPQNQPRSFAGLSNQDFASPSSSNPSGVDINIIGGENGDYTSLDDDTDPLSPGVESDPSSLSTIGRSKSSFDPKPEIVETQVNPWVVLAKISLPAFILALTMAVTYTIYPAILVKSKPTIDLTKGWYKLWLMLVFSIADFGTRSLPYTTLIKLVPVSSLDIFAYCRLVFIPIFVYSVYIQTIASLVLFITTALLGISNGIVFVITMRNYAQYVKDYEKPTAGSLMSIAVVVGVLVGNLFSILIDIVGKH